MTRRRRRYWIAVTMAVVGAGLGVGAVLFSQRPPQLGLIDGRLRSCPRSPNCVCSFDENEEHAIAPLDAHDDPAGTMQRLRDMLESQSRVRIVTAEDRYLHAEFTTPVLRFVDDVEFLLEETEGIIQVRSASRVGYSDFGVNRRRVETIRRQLADAGT